MFVEKSLEEDVEFDLLPDHTSNVKLPLKSLKPLFLESVGVRLLVKTPTEKGSNEGYRKILDLCHLLA